MLKIKIIDIIICCLYFAVFKTYLIPVEVQQISKIIMLVIVFLFIISNMPIKRLMNQSLLLSVSFILSGILSWKNNYIAFENVMEGFLYALCIYCIYTLIQYCYQIEYIEGFISLVFKLTFLYCVISIFSIMIMGTSTQGVEITYFFGSKFSTSYYFIMLTGFYLMKYKEKVENYFRYKIYYLGLSAITFIICAWIHCTTTMIASVFLIIIYLLPDKFKKLLMSWKILIISILVAASFVFIVDIILNNLYVQNFIENMLKKNLTLTGRLHIYDFLLRAFNESRWFGYGRSNSIIISLAGYGNAQNALWQLVINYGLIGVVLFVILIKNSISYADKSLNFFGAYIILYIMIICSTVEISYNYFFYTTLFLLRWSNSCQLVCNEYNEEP